MSFLQDNFCNNQSPRRQQTCPPRTCRRPPCPVQKPLFQAGTLCSPKTPRSRMSPKHSRGTLRPMLSLQQQSRCLLRTLSCYLGLPHTRIPPDKPSLPLTQTLQGSIFQQRQRNVACREFLQGRNTPRHKWCLSVSFRRRIRLGNTFLDQQCTRCTEVPLNLHRNCFGRCPPRTLDRSLRRPPIRR